MGWSFRKSFGAGPFRVSISSSGISGSCGIKGFKVGANRRGTWVSLGAGGIRYRQFTPHQRTMKSGKSRTVKADVDIPPGTHGAFETLQQRGIVDLSDGSAQQLLADLAARRKRVPNTALLKWPAGALLTVGFFYMPWNVLLLGGLIWWYVQRKRSTVMTLWYEFDAASAANWDSLRNALSEVGRAQAVWHLQARAAVHDRRYHAGAGHLLQRANTALTEAAPSFIETNVAPVCLFAGDAQLFFFPDRLLVMGAAELVAIDYAGIRVEVQESQFIETETVPSDARVAGHTWQYVNKDGSPDKRFSNNRQLPVCAYEQVGFFSSGGLAQQFQISRQGAGELVAEALRMFETRAAESYLSVSESEPERELIPDAAPPAWRYSLANPPPIPEKYLRSEVTPQPPEPPPSPAKRTVPDSIAVHQPSSTITHNPPPPPSPPAPKPLTQFTPSPTTAWLSTRAEPVPPKPVPPRTEPVKPPATASHQLSAAPTRVVAPRPAPEPPRERLAVSYGNRKWFGPGDSLTIHGLKIPSPMVYVQHGYQQDEEPSAIDLNLIAAENPAGIDEDFGYWPNYFTLSLRQRRAYLEWLACGRRDAEPARRARGHVFLFIYGLERRLLVDKEHDPALLEELLVLLEHYGCSGSGSLLSYGLQLLYFAAWLAGPKIDNAFWQRLLSLQDDGRSNEDILAFILGRLDGQRLDWQLALRVARTNEESRSSVVVDRAREKFVELFRHRYEETHPGGIELAAAKTPVTLTYRPATAAPILRQRPLQLKVPNVLGLRRQFKSLPEIWNRCVEELSGYSRALGSKKEGIEGRLATWESLPPALRANEVHPLTESISTLLASAPRERGFPILIAGALAEVAGLPARKSSTAKQSEILSKRCEDAGWRIAPDPRLTALTLDWSQEIALYPCEGVSLPAAGLVRFLFLAVMVAAADGSIDERELAIFNEAIAPESGSETDRRCLLATEAALCRDTHSATRSLTKIAAGISTAHRPTILRTLAHLAAVDGEAAPGEIKMLRRIARAFDLDEEMVTGFLDEHPALKEVKVASRDEPLGRSGEGIPPRQENTIATAFALDMGRVHSLTKETNEVISLLSEVMKEEEAAASVAPEVPARQENTAAAPAWCMAIEPRYRKPLIALAAHDGLTWTAFETLAAQEHLLPDDLLQSVNTWADETLGDFLLERSNDTVRIFRDLIPS